MRIRWEPHFDTKALSVAGTPVSICFSVWKERSPIAEPRYQGRKTMAKQFLLVVFLVFLPAFAAGAETFSITYENGRVVKRYPERSHPVIGLALSGGGARGLAHIGVIDELEKAGIRVERVAGTSIGSVVGGLYAAGYTPKAIGSFFQYNNFSQILSSVPNRRNVYIGQKEVTSWPVFDVRFRGFRAQILPSSWSSGQKLVNLLSWLTLGPTFECECDFDRLPIPFRSVATNCITGNAMVLGSGNLARAIQASCTIPGLFAPVEWEDSLLIDGGLTNNLPVNVARDMGSDFVIAVAIEESMHSRGELDNPINMADQVTSIPMRSVTAISRKMADFVITPDMTGFSSKNFGAATEMIERGRQAALDSIPALLERLAGLPESYRKATVRTIAVSPGEEAAFATAILSRHVSMGKTIPYDDIAASMEELWFSGRYCALTADLDPLSGMLSLTLIPTPRWVALRVVDRDRLHDTERTEVFSTGDDGQHSMQKLIEYTESRLHLVRTANSKSTFATITGQNLSVSRDTLQVTVSSPVLTGIFIDRGIKTKYSLIRREIDMEIGDTFDLKKAVNAIESLYGTNLFEHVYADVVPYNGGVGLRIHLKEKDWTVVRLGIKYDDFNSTEGRLNLSRENIFGLGNQMNLTLQSGLRNEMFIVENRNDRVFRSMYTFNLRAYRHERSRPAYGESGRWDDYRDERYGAVLSIGQVMDKLGNMVVQLRTESSRLKYPDSMGLKDLTHEYRSIVVRSLVDTYDRYPFPNNGLLNVLYLENSSKILGGSEQFVKIFWGATVVKSLTRRHTMSGSIYLGSSDPSIPENESFSLGGYATRLNCYNTDTGGSLFYADFMGLGNEEKFGTRLAVGKAAYRVFIPRYFYLEMIYGVGNVWKSTDTITGKSLLQSYGVRGTFDTYIGQLSLGWGVTSEGKDRWYMTAGREF